MEIIENMFYGVGQVALAIALADEKIDQNEIRAIEQEILRIQSEIEVDIMPVLNAFKLHAKNNLNNSAELLKSGIRYFHLGDLHLTPELSKIFEEILLRIVKLKPGVKVKEITVLESFLIYLKDRSKLASYRNRGYLKNILVTVELQDNKEEEGTRIKEVIKWLKPGFKVLLLHCISPEALKGNSFYTEKEKVLVKMNQFVTDYFGEEKARNQIEIDILFQRIEYLEQDYIDAKELDFIIMPTKGKEEDEYDRTTKTSEHIQRHFANYLVLPLGAKLGALHEILLLTDYKFTTLDQFEPILELCKLNWSRVTLLCIGDPMALSKKQIDKKEALKKYFEGHMEKCVYQSNKEYVYEDILKFSKQEKYDLMVALPMHNSFYNKFEGHLSVVKRLCQLSTIPLLILNQHTKRFEMDRILHEISDKV